MTGKEMVLFKRRNVGIVGRYSKYRKIVHKVIQVVRHPRQLYSYSGAYCSFLRGVSHQTLGVCCHYRHHHDHHQPPSTPVPFFLAFIFSTLTK